MKAMVFAAGVGSRLKPFTDHHPKALVPVGGVPMLQRVIEKIAAEGIKDVVVNVHHFANQITDFLSRNNNFGLDIVVSDERELLLDTGGGLLHAESFLACDDEPILLHNADILTDFSLSAMIKAYNSCGADALLMVGKRESSRQLYVSTDCKLVGWQNLTTGQTKPKGFSLQSDGLNACAFGGVHIISTALFPLLRKYAMTNGCVFSIMPFYLDNLEQLDIETYMPVDNYMWHDVGSAEKLAAANKSTGGLNS